MVKKPQILFVDDEPMFAETMARVLVTNNFEVSTSNTARAAIDLIEKNSYDLIITDINMPDMDGIQLIREVRKNHPKQRIMVVTGFPSRESQEEAYRMGIVNYLVKPFSLDRFLEVVLKALQTNGATSEGLMGPIELTCEDLIQMHSLSGKNLVLEISNDNQRGRIFFDKGKVVHAETNENTGEKAFHQILSWKTGTFKTEPLEKKIKPSITQATEWLLLEGARIQDEESNGKSKEADHGSEQKEGKKKDSQQEKKTQKKVKEKKDKIDKPKRRPSMASMVEEINAALKELAANTPGLGLALLVDNEGLPIARHTALEIAEGSAEKSAVASLALLGLARRTADQLDLKGFQEVLVKTDTGYIYALSVGGPTGYVLVTRTDENVTLGALFMTVRSARDRINQAMGVAPTA